MMVTAMLMAMKLVKKMMPKEVHFDHRYCLLADFHLKLYVTQPWSQMVDLGIREMNARKSMLINVTQP
ncbi:hypothetical protein AND_002739 [Anopheles darlingi]|uniref:Uncharacterized protein n=1 Tax=Anopheles darlingi TaxID=43151 RepID=W5JMB7_ANODA|nr:hypothetical protein AND_002739 [Anopheles darlingi]